MAIPTGATSVEAYGVSCMSAASCIAVGYNYPNGSVWAFAEHWDGVGWSLQDTPAPTGATGTYLNGVSFTSLTACAAVGEYDNRGGQEPNRDTLAERWNGTSWTVQPTPHPGPSARDDVLNGVSCASAAACYAVGFYRDKPSSEVTLAERWDGTSWAIQPTPSPADAGSLSALRAVSCTSASACVAVGHYINNRGAHVAMAESWNGSSWMVQSVPAPSGALSTSLNSVSCISAATCLAVGGYVDSARTHLPFAAWWNGMAWTLASQPQASTAGTGTLLWGVSCTSLTSCAGVGSVGYPYFGTDLAEGWNGTSWTIQLPA